MSNRPQAELAELAMDARGAVGVLGRHAIDEGAHFGGVVLQVGIDADRRIAVGAEQPCDQRILVPAIAFVSNLLLTMQGKWNMFVENLEVRFTITGVLMAVPLNMQGGFQQTRAINWYIHGTGWIVAHAHLALLGFSTFLEGAAIELAGRHVAGHRHERHRVEKGVAKRDRQIGRTRSTRREGRGRLAADAVIDVGHEAGDALVVHGNGLDVSLALEQRVDELDVAVPTQAEDVRRLLLDQIVDNDLGAIEHISRHQTFSLRLAVFL